MTDYSHVLVVSGGMDSATLAHLTKHHHGNPYLITFDYGQRHKKEIEYAQLLAENIKAPHKVIDISGINSVLGGSALTDNSIEVPEGHYEEETMAATVVPNRNAIMLTIAYALAVSLNIPKVGCAMHAGDHAIYPDCRPEFVQRFDFMQKCAVEGHGNPDLSLWTPFINKTKADIAKIGLSLGIDYSQTWSCYKGEEKHCGKCGTCVERKEAFFLIRKKDPTDYNLPDLLTV
jgi:7-cyano-7-deazaguanine synthase|tara:strand:- start:6492 stop:7187 length:696 start_codon:yes stop_codon:yes gene_type:complete